MQYVCLHVVTLYGRQVLSYNRTQVVGLSPLCTYTLACIPERTGCRQSDVYVCTLGSPTAHSLSQTSLYTYIATYTYQGEETETAASPGMVEASVAVVMHAPHTACGERIGGQYWLWSPSIRDP